MSDRPCNLVTYMQRRKKDYTLRLERDPSPFNPDGVRVVRSDGTFVCWYAMLPHPIECAAYGGTCDC